MLTLPGNEPMIAGYGQNRIETPATGRTRETGQGAFGGDQWNSKATSEVDDFAAPRGLGIAELF
ncbi:hypothetical protein MicloDRAFT_00059610 [Microvirga lotononidis]|uniref:Uncharacterized protein n=2 Tax=Microvirga lotononidis TaxID=864069 RepID=I4YMP7_9HYPH|nr:hypothetical protein MicloDRAFT_00059610 [Microvirga lotononidis]